MISRLLVATVAIAACILPSLAQEVGDPDAGRRIVDSQCAECHGAGLVRDRAPPFTAIARMPSTTALALAVFLRTSHPSMPNIILSPSEQDDVIAYILSLKN